MNVPGTCLSTSLVLAAALLASGAPAKHPEIGPLPPVPVPADNPITPAKIELGKMLFFDVKLSGDMRMSCAICHETLKGSGWSDEYTLSQGSPGSRHWRNTQTILNAAYYSRLNWDGSAPSLESQAAGAIEDAGSLNGDPVMVEERLSQIEEYVRRFKEVFGTERPRYGDVLKALAAFQREVPVSKNVPFDNYMKGDKGALSKPAVRGMALFKGKAGCIRCHNGPLFTDEGFHATGVPKNKMFQTEYFWQISLRYHIMRRGVPEEVYRRADRDLGLYFVTKREQDKGKFRTQGLRELKYTAPYMHNGTLETLDDVVEFYDRGAGTVENKSPRLRPLGLSAKEKNDLIAFLESLSGDEIVISPPEVPDFPKRREGLEASSRKLPEAKRRRKAGTKPLSKERKKKLAATLRRDLRDYTDIAYSPYGWYRKSAAWNKLAAKYPEWSAELSPGNTTGLLERAGSLLEWVSIPGGTFLMGSKVGAPLEKPVHRVNVPEFQLAKSEVTFGHYRMCVKAGACTPGKWDDLPAKSMGQEQPVVRINWHQAKTFAKWVGGRLPTEAEWEYAARSAGQDRKYPWGDEKPTCDRAVVGDGCGRGATWPVCSKPRGNTEQGVCDMFGNAWEFVEDHYHGTYEGAPTDGSAWPSSTDSARVARGDAWRNDFEMGRVTSRSRTPTSEQFRDLGFRPARSR